MITALQRSVLRTSTAISLLILFAGSASALTSRAWVDRTFAKARIVHVQKEMVAFTADLQMREAFLEQLIANNTSELRMRKRLGGQLPAFNWPAEEAGEYWRFLDTINLVKSFDEFRTIRTNDYITRLAAARTLKRDLLATATPIERNRMRGNDWASFERFAGGGAISRLDPPIAMLFSDEYGRNYPEALADSFWFSRGEVALNGGFYDEAIIAYNKVVSSGASQFRPRAFLRLAFIYSETGSQADLESNWTAWNDAGKPLAGEGRMQFHTGRARYQAGDYAAAITSLLMVPHSSPYYLRSKLLASASFGMIEKFDSAMVELDPFVSKKLANRLNVDPELSVYGKLKYAQMQNFAGRSRDALQTLALLDSRDMFGDQILFTRAWVYRSMSKYTEMSLTLDTLVRRAAWSSFIPLANAWLAEAQEIKSGVNDVTPVLEKIMGMLEQSQAIADFTEERYQLYSLLTELNVMEGEIIQENDIGQFAKYIDQRSRVMLLLQRNINGAALTANPVLKDLFQEEVASAQLSREISGITRAVDRRNNPKDLQEYFKLTDQNDNIALNLQRLMEIAQNLTPAIQREQDVLAFNKRVRALGKSSREWLSGAKGADQFATVDRAVLTVNRLDRAGSQLLSSRLDEIATNIDRYAGFAMTRYALGGFDFDLLSRKTERSDELTYYIKRLETLLKEKSDEAEELAAQEAETQAVIPAKPSTETPQQQPVTPEQK